ncbi:30S ribosomal protein S21 [Robertkochia solimangrovi]|uniref:30S ribosomal protein S21 n=1 Tax=Robertkochia solimangrovi TaxID=2213046 RepID=UPI00117F5988|nr:30S ribosomal protein S21 [Robertkochia solimangrovi]TRZ41850.1 30S ribosomal protein S21 [Robertkochia solimangrovi]
MLIINVKQGETIERALKRYRQKVNRTKQIKNLRDNQQFVKKSELRRKEIAKAVYKQEFDRQHEG